MGTNPSDFKGNNLPVEMVSWLDVTEFVRKLNEMNHEYTYRLPTEAEWEYACRAGTTGDYAGNLDAMAWYDANSSAKTHPVGTKQPNAFGLYDMHGNVMEWCQDWYHLNYDGAPVDGSAWEKGGSHKMRVYRGGSWVSPAFPEAHSANRGYGAPDRQLYFLGFRLVAVARS
jgi:formylglycine-generating enzyme required for sulfatase activity